MSHAAESGRCLAVVLNWCREEDTARCLTALVAEQSRVSVLDILLVDSASPDGSGARVAARFPAIPYLPLGENLGYAGGNQRAIEWALARGYASVLLVNDDAELMPGCVAALLAVLDADASVGAAAPTITFGGADTQRIWYAGGRFVWWKGLGVHDRLAPSVDAVQAQCRDPVPVSFLSGCVLLLRATAIRQSGGLRPEFFAYVEDAELSHRWLRDGWRLLWVPQALARHHTPLVSGPPSPRAIVWRDRNRRRVAALHFAPWQRAIFSLWLWSTRLVLMLAMSARRDWDRVRALWNGLTTR